MNKTELVNEVSTRSKVSQAGSKSVIDAALKVVGEALAKGEAVQIAGFGTFCRRERAGRVCRNPQTGEAMEVPAKAVPCFKPGKELRNAVN